MHNYNGKDPDVHSGLYFALPAECSRLMGNGRITVSQYLTHVDNLIIANLWIKDWDEVDATLRHTIGPKFFYLMANLDMNNFRELVSIALKQTVQYVDYAEECAMKKLLEREAENGPEGMHARESLRRLRSYFLEWKDRLWGANYTFKEEVQGVTTTAVNGTVVGVSSGAGRQTFASMWIIVGSILDLTL
jgi:hypothetical protein